MVETAANAAKTHFNVGIAARPSVFGVFGRPGALIGIVRWFQLLALSVFAFEITGFAAIGLNRAAIVYGTNGDVWPDHWRCRGPGGSQALVRCLNRWNLRHIRDHGRYRFGWDAAFRPCRGHCVLKWDILGDGHADPAAVAGGPIWRRPANRDEPRCSYGQWHADAWASTWWCRLAIRWGPGRIPI